MSERGWDELARELEVFAPGQGKSMAKRLEAGLLDAPGGESLRLKELIKAVDDSSAPATEWGHALLVLLDWLKAQGKRALFTDVLGYLSCCADSQARAGVQLPLPKVTANFLSEGGFERAR